MLQRLNGVTHATH